MRRSLGVLGKMRSAVEISPLEQIFYKLMLYSRLEISRLDKTNLHESALGACFRGFVAVRGPEILPRENSACLNRLCQKSQ